MRRNARRKQGFELGAVWPLYYCRLTLDVMKWMQNTNSNPVPLKITQGFPFNDIEFLGKYDDKANVETAARLTADLLAAHPDLAGIAGFDSNSGPGMALSVKEANKSGKVKLTTVDAEPEHLQLVKEGVISYLVGQKRELFTWMGAQFLFDMRHKSLPLSGNDARAGIIPIPRTVITGSIEIDSTNINIFLQNAANK